jgi:hypothetical protein
MIPDYNPYFMFFPRIPVYNEMPPTLYSILESIVNYGKYPKTPIRNIAKEGRSRIFYFDYPLSSNVSKEKFETMILNHFLKRRINYDTMADFCIQLDVKLNEIMPLYNKLFDSLENWDIFNDGEVVTETGQDTKISNQNGKTTNESSQNSNSSNNISTNSQTTANSTNDRRYSDTPQDQLNNVQNGTYLTDYTYDQNNSSGQDNSTSNGTSNSITSSNSEENRTQNQNDSSNYNKTIKRSPADKIAIYKEMQDSIKSIYTMIFKDLEVLFYGLE